MDIEKIKRKLLVKYPLFGGITANLKYIENKECGTAATDGENIYFNPDYMQNLSEEEQVFIFAHEVCHVAFDHIHRSEGKDPELWNIATDSVINALLQNDGLKMVKGGVDIPEAINYNAETMYNKLLKEREQQQEQSGEHNQGGKNQQHGNSQSGQQSGIHNNEQGENQSNQQSGKPNEKQGNKQPENKDVGHDTHSLWEEAIEKRKQKEKQSEDGNGGKEQEEQQAHENIQKKSKTKEEKEIEEAIKKITEMGENKAFKQNKIEKAKRIEELREALARKSTGVGNSTNSIDRKVQNIGTASPLIDWRKLLREAIKVEVDWSYKNATVEDGVVTPHLEEIPMPETEILLDTSGSINEALLRNFLRECKNILKSSKVKVGCFDTRFYGFEEIHKVDDIDNMKFRGGGGTDFDVAVNAFSRRVENKIIFTDGEASMPEKMVNAIWIVFGNRDIKPKGGRVIRISDEQLKRLSHFVNKDDLYR